MTKGTLLITGASGYIGSHTVVDVIQNGYDVIAIDDHSRSFSHVYDGIRKIITPRSFTDYTVDMKSLSDLHRVFENHPDIIGVIHFAAYKSVVESVENPLIYYDNNLTSLINLLKCCSEFNVKYIVFSSSCTVYGVPDSIPVRESTPFKPANCPYGSTKQMGEQILNDFVKRTGNIQQVCILRYFNPAGAHPSLHIGEIPNGGVPSLTSAIVSVATGKKEGPLRVFGSDYPTRDGSCVRDFIHVCDIAHAHTLAIDYMIAESSSSIHVFNLGKGDGNTVLEAITAFERVNSIRLTYIITDRRPGDVPAIYSDSSLANSRLRWMPQYSLDDIMRTAYNFAIKN